MKNEVGNLNSHQKVPIWTMFYYFILIVQELNFPLAGFLSVPLSQGGKETNITNDNFEALVVNKNWGSRKETYEPKTSSM